MGATTSTNDVTIARESNELEEHRIDKDIEFKLKQLESNEKMHEMDLAQKKIESANALQSARDAQKMQLDIQKMQNAFLQNSTLQLQTDLYSDAGSNELSL